jgi:hypothetical protein
MGLITAPTNTQMVNFGEFESVQRRVRISTATCTDLTITYKRCDGCIQHYLPPLTSSLSHLLLSFVRRNLNSLRISSFSISYFHPVGKMSFATVAVYALCFGSAALARELHSTGGAFPLADLHSWLSFALSTWHSVPYTIQKTHVMYFTGHEGSLMR